MLARGKRIGAQPSRSPAALTEKTNCQAALHLLCVITLPTHYALNGKFSPENWIIWSEIILGLVDFSNHPNPPFTHLLPESYSSPKPPQSAPWYHFCSPKTPSHHYTHESNLQRSYSPQNPLSKRNLRRKHVYKAHSRILWPSQPLSPADCPMQTAVSGVLGQTRPIVTAICQCINEVAGALRDGPTPLTLQCTLILKGKACTLITKSFLPNSLDSAK